MTQKEKCVMLKNSIYQLYTNEGHSKSYIARLLEIDRKTLTNCIKEWKFPENTSKLYITPSTQKFINRNKDFIKKHLKEDDTISNIAAELKVDRKKIYNIFKYNTELNQCFLEYQKRKELKKQSKIDNSSLDYNFKDLENEEWREILGYDNYFISNKGRFKKYMKTYDKCCLLKKYVNPLSGREQIVLSKDGKQKTLSVARLVGFAFLLDSYDKDNKNTINHKDGNVLNNCVDNLEWCSQSENNLHSYHTLHRSIVDKRKYHFNKILYKNKYEFNTVVAFAKFLGKSKTQTRRYMDEPEKHDIQFILYENN